MKIWCQEFAFDMSIKAIDIVSIHKICSGQVIADLSSAVKEVRVFVITIPSNCIVNCHINIPLCEAY